MTSLPEPVLIRRRAIVAPLLLSLNVLWFVGGWVLAVREAIGVPYLKGVGHPIAAQILSRMGAVSAPDLLRGEWWRLLSTCFVHAGLLHVLVNMLMLAALGSVSERLWGWKRFLVIYLGSGFAGSVAAMALHPAENGAATILVGASGALWGVLASVIVWYLRYRDRLPAGMAREWRRKLGLALLFNALVSLAPGISWQAHAGGALAGAALTYWLDRRAIPYRGLSALGVVAFLAILSGGLFGAMRAAPVWERLRESEMRPQFEPPPNIPPAPVSERERVAAALGECDLKIAPQRFKKLIDRIKTADYILGVNTPKTVAEVRALRGDVDEARVRLRTVEGRFAARVGDYVEILSGLLNAIEAWQASPPRGALDEILAEHTAAVEAWVRLSQP